MMIYYLCIGVLCHSCKHVLSSTTVCLYIFYATNQGLDIVLTSHSADLVHLPMYTCHHFVMGV